MNSAVLWGPVVAAIAALSGVWLQSHLTRRQTFRNRLWDLQREAYGDIFAGMIESRHACDELIHFLEHESGKPGARPGRAQDLVTRWSEAVASARRRAARDGLILPAEFTSAYRSFAQRMRELDGDTTMTVERLKLARQLIDSGYDELENIAKKHLQM